MAVNMMAKATYFNKIKPEYYLMSDHAFFTFEKEHFIDASAHPRVKKNKEYQQTQENVNETWNQLLNADWPIKIYVPQLYRKSYIAQLAIEKGTQIIFYNYTVVKGFEWFENLIYSAGMGSPQCQNVINSCIFQCLNIGFNEIYLVGIENDFHRQIEVGDDNIIYTIDSHFYEVKNKKSPLIKNHDLSPVRVYEFFGSLSKAFFAYERLNKYASYKNAKIYNATNGSFVDSFERKQLPIK